MAERLEEFDFRLNTQRGSHDWDRLLDGTIWRLVEGVDFTCTPDSMRKMVYQRSWKKGGSAHTDMSEDGVLIIQYYDKEQAGDNPPPVSQDDSADEADTVDLPTTEEDPPIPDEFADLVDSPDNDGWPEDE